MTILPPLLNFALHALPEVFTLFCERTSMAKAPSAKSITKSELFAQLAEETSAPKADVKKFFEALTSVILKNLGKKGPGVLTLPGLFKLRSVKKPAVKRRQTSPESLHRPNDDHGRTSPRPRPSAPAL